MKQPDADKQVKQKYPRAAFRLVESLLNFDEGLF